VSLVSYQTVLIVVDRINLAQPVSDSSALRKKCVTFWIKKCFLLQQLANRFRVF